MLLPLKSHAAKLFYAQKAMKGRLGKRDLRQMIARKTFERTAIADAQLATESPVPYIFFKDPYLFDFLGLKDDYLENEPCHEGVYSSHTQPKWQAKFDAA